MMSIAIQGPVLTANVVHATAALPTFLSSPQAQELATRLRGRTILLPNVKKSLASWPVGISEHLDEVRALVDESVARITTHPKKARGLRACDFGFLASCAFAEASWDRIQAAALFLLWIFVWDDEIDHGEGQNDISTCSEIANAYCQESLDYIRWTMGLCGNDAKEPVCNIQTMPVFREVARAMVEKMDLVQRQGLYNELNHYIQQVLVEQTGQQIGYMPTTEEYTRMRLGTSGITPGLAFCEYTSEVKLPREIMESTEMRVMWKEATSLCMMINDMYSMKKEVKSGALQNMIPVMINANPSASIEAIMDEFADMFARSVAGFEGAYQVLNERTKHEGKLNADLASYVNGCQCIVTGLLQWSLMTPRYQIAACLQEDGSAIVSL